MFHIFRLNQNILRFLNRSLFLILLLLFSQNLCAQFNRFIPYKLKNDVWIYVRPASAKPVIEEEFQLAQPFNYLGFAKVKLDDKWQWIDTNGKHVFTEYDSLNYLQNRDLFIAYKKGKSGVFSGLNRTILVPLDYENIQVLLFGDPENIAHFSNATPYNSVDLIGTTTTKGKKKSKLIQIALDEKSKPRVQFSTETYQSIFYSNLNLKAFNSRLFLVEEGGFFGMLSSSAAVIIPPNYDEIQLIEKANSNVKSASLAVGNTRFFIASSKKYQTLFNSEGQNLLKSIYTSVSPLENCALPIFRLQNKSDLQGLYFANTSQIIEPKYITINYIDNVNAVVCRDKKWIDFYNHLGTQLLSKLESSEFKKVSKKAFKYLSVNGLSGLMKGNNEVLLTADFDEIKSIGSDKLVAIRKKDLWAFYHIENKKLGGFDFRFIGKNSSIGLIPVSNVQQKFGYMNEESKWIIQPKYNSASNFNELNLLHLNIVDNIQMASVSINGKFGFIDAKGNLFTQLEFDSAQGFSGLMAAVKSKNGWQVIGKGKKQMSRYYQNVRIHSGVAIIHHKDSSGILDFEGKWMFPMSKTTNFTILDHSSDNFPFQRIHDNVSFTQVGIVNSTGRLILKMEDFTIENLDSTHWLLLGKKQSAVIDVKGEISQLNVSGLGFEWLNDKHTLGMFKTKNGAIEKLKYFSGITRRILVDLEDLKVAYDEETTHVKVSKNGMAGLLSESDFQLILPAKYSEITPVIGGLNDLYIVRSYNGNYGVVNRKNEFKIAFENQFVFSKYSAVESKKGCVNEVVLCVKKADKIEYYNALMQKLYVEMNDLSNGFRVVSSNLFEISDANQQVLYYVDSKGFKYERLR
jgi:hypothetical protein